MPNAGGDCNRKTKECAKFRKRNISRLLAGQIGQIRRKTRGLRTSTPFRGNAAAGVRLQNPVTNAI
jgi:hypothetical protein